MPLSGVGSRILHPKLIEGLQTISAGTFVASGEFTESVALRRDSSTIAAQNVRFATIGGGSTSVSPGSEEQTGKLRVIGAPSLDIAIGDRFNDSQGILYEVVYIRPERAVQTVAEAQVKQ